MSKGQCSVRTWNNKIKKKPLIIQFFLNSTYQVSTMYRDSIPITHSLQCVGQIDHVIKKG